MGERVGELVGLTVGESVGQGLMSMLKSPICSSFGPGCGSPSQLNHVAKPNWLFLSLAPRTPTCARGSPTVFSTQVLFG